MHTTKGKRILIIDDDEDITNLFQTFLEYDGYKVDASTDPIDALYSFRKNVYDLALIDLKMPKMNGLILSQKLKNIDPALLFCYITADKEYIQNLKNSISDIEKIVIYKPILLSELRDKIHFLLLSKYQAEEVENKLLMIL
ncbi:MAG TPA: response regulator [Nitrososphaeraceae archaeon]|nr:response regulator [Nitrososphaeraceae archaeon]